MNIVFLSVYNWSVGDIDMDKSRFIFFEFPTDSFSGIFSLLDESPRFEMIIGGTPWKESVSLLEGVQDIHHI